MRFKLNTVQRARVECYVTCLSVRVYAVISPVLVILSWALESAAVLARGLRKHVSWHTQGWIGKNPAVTRVAVTPRNMLGCSLVADC